VHIGTDNKQFQKSTEFLLKNYIHPDANFAPKSWSEFTPSKIRTTKACEFFHSHCNSMFYSAHPNIFQFKHV